MLYKRLAGRLAALIERGTLKPGDRLPSLRRTSTAEGVSVTTSLHAYALLEMRGYVEARPQSGFYVRPLKSRDTREPELVAPPRRTARVEVGGGVAAVMRAAQNSRLVPLGAACPAPSLLPSKRLAQLMATVMRGGEADTNTYTFPPGRPELREALARRAVAWGGAFAADDFLITHGATEALTLALLATTRRGDLVAVESPAYFGTLLLLETLGLRAVEVATDPRDGISVDDLAAVLERHDVAAVVASPTCHNPLGSVMPDRAKQTLLALLEGRDLPLIEDDVYGEASHVAERPAPAKKWDRDGRVILCSSFSKTLAPGYRIGWVAGGRYHADLTRLKLATTLATSTAPQLAIAAFLRSSSYPRFMTQMRLAFRDQVTLGREAVARFFPQGSRITQPAGGFVLWIALPDGCDADQLAADALDAGISIASGSLFSPSGRYRNCLRLSCGHPWSAAMDRAVQTLGRLASGRR